MGAAALAVAIARIESRYGTRVMARGDVADGQGHALGDVGLAAVGRAEAHRGRHVEDQPARHRALADTLPGTPRPNRSARGEVVPAPARAYLRRLPFFRDYRQDELDDVMRRVSFERVAAGTLLVSEGERPRALFVTTNGAAVA